MPYRYDNLQKRDGRKGNAFSDRVYAAACLGSILSGISDRKIIYLMAKQWMFQPVYRALRGEPDVRNSIGSFNRNCCTCSYYMVYCKAVQGKEGLYFLPLFRYVREGKKN